MKWAGIVACMGRERCVQGLVRERDHLEDSGLDGRIVLRWILRKWDVGMDWIDLAKGRDRWRALVNAVITCGFHKMRGIS